MARWRSLCVFLLSLHLQLSGVVGCSLYSTATATYDWHDPATNGHTALAESSNDQSWEYACPFPIQLDCESYSVMYITSEGYVRFENATVVTANSATLLTRSVAVCWDDWQPQTSGKVYVGVEGTSPNRIVIVSWDDVRVNGAFVLMTFQVHFYENSTAFAFHYKDGTAIFSSHDNGKSATIGVRGANRTTLFSHLQASIDDSFAVEFTLANESMTPAPTPPPNTAPTLSPTTTPSMEPTPSPTSAPTPSPTSSPTPSPTAAPTPSPTSSPTPSPTSAPTPSPTSAPTAAPTSNPTLSPTSAPTSTAPTLSPTAAPTPSPTSGPTVSPSAAPTLYPTLAPSMLPTQPPSQSPTNLPVSTPTPTVSPTVSPTQAPTTTPTAQPSTSPTPLSMYAPTVVVHNQSSRWSRFRLPSTLGASPLVLSFFFSWTNYSARHPAGPQVQAWHVSVVAVRSSVPLNLSVVTQAMNAGATVAGTSLMPLFASSVNSTHPLVQSDDYPVTVSVPITYSHLYGPVGTSTVLAIRVSAVNAVGVGVPGPWTVVGPCQGQLPCGAHGVCVGQASGPFTPFTCSCMDPFAGRTCHIDLRTGCDPNRCLNGAECTASLNALHQVTFSCSCAHGWSGSLCGLDVDECSQARGGCDALTQCYNNPGNYSCSACPAGYHTYTPTSGNPAVYKPHSCVRVVTRCALGNGSIVDSAVWSSGALQQPSVATSELGHEVRCWASLSRRPTGAVSVRLQSSRIAEGEVVLLQPGGGALEFLQSNWNVPQEFRVRGVRDNVTDGDQDFCVSARVGSDSAAPEYAGLHQPCQVHVCNRHVAFPAVSSVSPKLLPLAGRLITISGTQFEAPLTVRVGGLPAEVIVTGTSLSGTHQVIVKTPNASLLDWHESYRSLEVVNNGNGSYMCPYDCPAESQLFVTDRCEKDNYFGSGLDCRPCPQNAVCPGGYRIWPMRGYWVDSETAIGSLVRCSAPATRCGGGRGAHCSVGYQGYQCTECTSHYYSAGTVCLPCSTASDQQEGLTVLLIALCVFGGCSVLIIFGSNRLTNFAADGLVMAQQAIIVGSSMSGSLSSEFENAYFYLRALALDWQFIKPECKVGKVPYPVVWMAYVVFFCCVSGLFAAAALLHQYRQRKSPREQWARNPTHPRLGRALLMTFHLSYILGFKRTLEMVHCRRSENGLRLFVEPATVCYEGLHLYAAILAWPVLLLYFILTPLLLLRMLHRHWNQRISSKDGKVTSAIHSRLFVFRWGFLYHYLQRRYYWYRLTSYLFSALLVLVSTLVHDKGPDVVILYVCIIVGIEFLLAIYTRPGFAKYHNQIILAESAGTFLAAGLLYYQVGDVKNGSRALAVISAVILASFLSLYFFNPRNVLGGEADEDEDETVRIISDGLSRKRQARLAAGRRLKSIWGNTMFRKALKRDAEDTTHRLQPLGQPDSHLYEPSLSSDVHGHISVSSDLRGWRRDSESQSDQVSETPALDTAADVSVVVAPSSAAPPVAQHSPLSDSPPQQSVDSSPDQRQQATPTELSLRVQVIKPLPRTNSPVSPRGMRVICPPMRVQRLRALPALGRVASDRQRGHSAFYSEQHSELQLMPSSIGTRSKPSTEQPAKDTGDTTTSVLAAPAAPAATESAAHALAVYSDDQHCADAVYASAAPSTGGAAPTASANTKPSSSTSTATPRSGKPGKPTSSKRSNAPLQPNTAGLRRQVIQPARTSSSSSNRSSTSLTALLPALPGRTSSSPGPPTATTTPHPPSHAKSTLRSVSRRAVAALRLSPVGREQSSGSKSATGMVSAFFNHGPIRPVSARPTGLRPSRRHVPARNSTGQSTSGPSGLRIPPRSASARRPNRTLKAVAKSISRARRLYK